MFQGVRFDTTRLKAALLKEELQLSQCDESPHLHVYLVSSSESPWVLCSKHRGATAFVESQRLDCSVVLRTLHDFCWYLVSGLRVLAVSTALRMRPSPVAELHAPRPLLRCLDRMPPVGLMRCYDMVDPHRWSSVTSFDAVRHSRSSDAWVQICKEQPQQSPSAAQCLGVRLIRRVALGPWSACLWAPASHHDPTSPRSSSPVVGTLPARKESCCKPWGFQNTPNLLGWLMP